MTSETHSTPPPSDRRQRVQDRFKAKRLGDLDAWIDKQREDGVSWANMSFALRELIGIDVSYETLRRWSRGDDEEAGPGADVE